MSTKTFVDGWALNGAVRIHYLDRPTADAAKVPLVVSPGIWEPAERAIPLFETMDRRTLSLSYRGRGRSDTPATGYDLEDHVGDLAAVVERAGVDHFCLLAFSRGVGPAVSYAVRHPRHVAGLVIVDHRPIHYAWAPGTAAVWKARVYLGRPFTDFMRAEALDGIEREARHVELWTELHRLACPVLLLRGLALENPIPPEMTEDDSFRYRTLVRDCREATFERSGHMIPDEEPEKYFRAVNEFLATIDQLAVPALG